MIYFGRVCLRSLQRLFRGANAQVDRGHVSEGAVVLGHRGSAAFENDDLFHQDTPTGKSISHFLIADRVRRTDHGGAMTEKFGKYVVLRQIGSGGFGSVFEARDPVIERAVAIKTCHVQDEEVRARFLQEARLAGNLHHRNLTTIYDIGAEGEVLYLVCEFLPGEDLDAFIDRDLSLIEQVEILIGVAYGLA